MPCRDDARIPLPDAALCAILKALVKLNWATRVIEEIDWQEAGITEDELYRWWSDHKVADRNIPRVW